MEAEQKDREDPALDQERRNALCLIMAEVLFFLLPFIIIGMVLFYGGNVRRLFYQPEWSLAASVLCGQAVVKLISGFLSRPYGDGRTAWEKISLWITSVIVLCLAPSLLILSLILTAKKPSKALVISQVVFFFVGLLVFILFGWLGELLLALGGSKHDAVNRLGQQTQSPNLANSGVQQPSSVTSSLPSAPDVLMRNRDAEFAAEFEAFMKWRATSSSSATIPQAPRAPSTSPIPPNQNSS
jgi:uncharacterized Tic20 family protein